jgi:hypothetical protein
VNTYPSLAATDLPIADIASKVHPSIPIAELVRRTVAGRDFARGELWYQVDEAK